MSKKITITEQIEELQEENERLKGLQKLFEKAVKDEFGFSVKEVHKLISAHVRYQQQQNASQRTTQGPQSASEQSED